nr:immunoglobulin heavy chain junction region [Mus musculus]
TSEDSAVYYCARRG